jgi:hypothetical protein
MTPLVLVSLQLAAGGEPSSSYGYTHPTLLSVALNLPPVVLSVWICMRLQKARRAWRLACISAMALALGVGGRVWLARDGAPLFARDAYEQACKRVFQRVSNSGLVLHWSRSAETHVRHLRQSQDLLRAGTPHENAVDADETLRKLRSIRNNLQAYMPALANWQRLTREDFVASGLGQHRADVVIGLYSRPPSSGETRPDALVEGQRALRLIDEVEALLTGQAPEP